MKHLNQSEYAAHRGISQQRVSQLIRDGYLDGALKTFGNRKLIDQEKADKFLSERLSQDRCTNPSQDKKSNPTPEETKAVVEKAGLKMVSLAEAQKNRANYEAALKKLELEEKTGEVVNAEQVNTDFFNIARTVRDSILNIPGRLSAELASMTDVHMVNEKLKTELTAALEELSR